MSAIVALINRPVVKALGQACVYLCAAAILTFFVLEFRTIRAERIERQRNTLLVLDALKDAKADRQVQQMVVDELARTVWGSLEPRVEKQEQRPVVRVPTWQGCQQEMSNRLKRLEEWRLRHMSQEH
jgi:hypothetical protein